FYADLVALLGLPDDLPDQNDRAQWPQMKKVFGDAVRGRALAEWLDAAEGHTPCIAPVLDVDEAPSHPHHVARGTFVEVDGLVQPAPAPRFSRSAAAVDRRPPSPGEHTTEILSDWAPTNGCARARYDTPPPKPDRSHELTAPTWNRRTEEGVNP
ncbi:MAG: CoA transferase, partial [Rhodococcus ruber]|nr:CoA transferase [Rhodococcus ruber]